MFLSLWMGIFFVVSTPPFQAPDEYFHYSRVLQISEGQFLPVKQGNVIGAYLSKDQKEFLHIVYEKPKGLSEMIKLLGQRDSQVTNSFSRGTTTYNPIIYTPQVLGVIVAESFHANQPQAFYLARLFALIFFVVVVYFAIKMLPIKKWFFVAIATLPMVLFLAASNSADVTAISVFIFIVAFFLHLLSKSKMSKNDYFIIILTTLFIAALKAPYFFVVFLYFFIPKDKFIKPKDRIYIFLVLLFILVSVNLLWVFLTREYNAIAIGRAMYPTILSDPRAQKNFIIGHPLQYTKVFIKTIWQQGNYYINSCIGVLGPLTVWFNQLIYTSYMVVIVTTLLGEAPNTVHINKKTKLAALFLFIFIATSIITVMYITWTPLKLSIVEGVQGRYFIPLLFLLPIFTKGLFYTKINKQVSFPLFVMGAIVGLSLLVGLKFFIFYQ